MSTLAMLKEAVKGFVYNNSNYTDHFQGGTDAAALEAKLDAAILVAANNARSRAEKMHDFAYNRVDVLVELTNAGLNLFNLGAGKPKIKKLEGADLVTNAGAYQPMKLTSLRDLRMRMRVDTKVNSPDDRYGVIGGMSLDHESQLTLNGMILNSYPLLSAGQTMNLMLRGHQWTPRWTALDATTDWMIEVGFEFLMWSIIVEVNYITQMYVPRQEGSLSPPEKLRDEAWEALITVDSDMDNYYNE